MITLRNVVVGMILAVSFTLGGALLNLVPADAEDETPWYMPQPWMFPQQTGPTAQWRIRYYSNMQYAYGSFLKQCYGGCGLGGATRSGQGAYLRFSAAVPRSSRATARPISTYDIVIVQQGSYAPPRHQSVQYSPAKQKQPLQFSIENGVRILRPRPTM